MKIKWNKACWEFGASHIFSTQEMLVYIFYRWGSILQLNCIPCSLEGFKLILKILILPFLKFLPRFSLYSYIGFQLPEEKRQSWLFLRLGQKRTDSLASVSLTSHSHCVVPTAVPQTSGASTNVADELVHRDSSNCTSFCRFFFPWIWKIASFMPGNLGYLLNNLFIQTDISTLY